MEMFKKLIEKIKKPRGWPLAVFYVVFALFLGGAITMLVLDFKSAGLIALSCFVYAVAAVCIGYAVYTVVYFVPRIKKSVLSWSERYEFTHKFFRNYSFRTALYAIFSFAISVAYALFEGVLGLLESSVWFGALSGYYIILSVMRGSMLFTRKKQDESEAEAELRKAKSYRLCGIFLLLLNLALPAAVLQMVLANESFRYAGLMIYVSAAYTFFKIIMAIINLVKARKSHDLKTQALRNINLADALVSILALQTAMFQAFSPATDVRYFNSATGAAVCLIIVVMGIAMWVRGQLRLKKLKSEKPPVTPLFSDASDKKP